MRSSSLAVAAFLLCLGAGAGLGCAPAASLAAVRCPNPVLLGPVDRIGGHRADAAVTVGRVDGDVDLFGGLASKESVLAVPAAGSVELGAAILDVTQGRADRDVRVDHVDVGSHVLFAGGVFVVERWAAMNGRVVEVPRAR